MTGLLLQLRFLSNSTVLQHHLNLKPELNTNNWLSLVSVEDLVIEDWSEKRFKVPHRDHVIFSTQRVSFELKRLANGKDSDQNPLFVSTDASFEILTNYSKQKHTANGMAPQPSKAVSYIESTYRYQHQSQLKVRHKHDAKIN